MTSVETRLGPRIAAHRVPAGHLVSWWLGGSGFIFKEASGTQFWIDPYLSNVVAKIFNQERAFPAPISLKEAEPDFVLCTHLHEDHLDPGFIPMLAVERPSVTFIMPPTAMGRARSWGVPQAQIVTMDHGESKTFGRFRVTSIPARHIAGPGFECPDAMGVIVECGNVRIYHSGDTEYDVRLRELRRERLTLATICINGISGNMNAQEAALLAWHLRVGMVMPHHHLLWDRKEPLPGETLDPRLFADTYHLLNGKARVILPEIGQSLDIFE